MENTMKTGDRYVSRLASEEQKQSMNIQDLSIDFCYRIVRLSKHLEHYEKEYILSRQLLRSGTSIGANIREAQHAQSEMDFLSKMSIALKEASETEFWLEILRNNGYLEIRLADSILNDCLRIKKTLICITATTAKKYKKKNKQSL